jgi:hypothetical protein
MKLIISKIKTFIKSINLKHLHKKMIYYIILQGIMKNLTISLTLPSY